MTSIGTNRALRDLLVGRRSELESMQKLLGRVKSGSAGAVAVLGELGIGKTHLLGEFCERAAKAGLVVLAGRGSELEREIPYALIIEALDEKFAALDAHAIAELGPNRLAELAAVLPSVSGRGKRLSSRLEAERFEFHRAVRATLEWLARRRPAVLVLDDVHWADPASLELIRHLLRHPVPGMLLAIAYRHRQAPQLLLDAVEKAARESLVSELALAPFTITEAADALGQQPDSPTLQSLYTQSGGNPFYLEQLARTARQRQTLPIPLPETAREEPDLPPTLRATVARELSVLTPERLGVLEAAAVAGDPFDSELVSAIVDADEELVLGCLDELVVTDLLRATSTPGQFRFRHPIVRRVVYDQAMPGWRFGAHKRAARALTARGATVGIRAHHIEHSSSPGDEEAAATLCEAGQAVVYRAPAAAARWFEAALRLLPTTTTVQQRVALLVSSAGALASSGRLNDSRATLEQALELLAPDSVGDQLPLIGMIARADHGLGLADAAYRRIVTTLDRVAPGSADAIRLELALAENHLMRRQWDQAIAAAERARSDAQTLGDPTLLIASEACLAWVMCPAGDIVRVQELAASVADELTERDILSAPELLDTLANLVDTDVNLERFQAADRLAERGLEASRATGHGHVFVRLMIGSAATKLHVGRLSEARDAAESAVEAALLLDNDALRTVAESLRCWIETLSGNLPEAFTAGHAAIQAADRTPQAHYAWLAHACYGDLLIESGEFEKGRQKILQTGGPELTDIFPTSRAYWYQALVTAELAAGRLDAAEAILGRLEASAQGLRSREAQAHHVRARIQAARGDFRRAAASAQQAQVYFDSAEMRVWAARARITAGRALAQANEPTSAILELQQAHSTLQASGAARLADEAAQELRNLGKRVRRLPTSSAETNSAGLTERELDIAKLIAQGYSNRKIAAELFISPKTVEKHVARVFTKLGISSRAGVGSAMDRTAASEMRK